MPHYDVIVAGVGGMGSAALYHLARRGLSVLGLERYDIPHAMGSSHGVNRIIRMAYFEDPSYVPLLRRAYELWRELEGVSGERILVITGGLDAAPEDHRVFRGSLQSCREHGLAHEVLTAAEVRRRFPGYALPSSHMAIFQPDGWLRHVGTGDRRPRRSCPTSRCRSSRPGGDPRLGAPG